MKIIVFWFYFSNDPMKWVSYFFSPIDFIFHIPYLTCIEYGWHWVLSSVFQSFEVEFFTQFIYNTLADQESEPRDSTDHRIIILDSTTSLPLIITKRMQFLYYDYIQNLSVSQNKQCRQTSQNGNINSFYCSLSEYIYIYIYIYIFDK